MPDAERTKCTPYERLAEVIYVWPIYLMPSEAIVARLGHLLDPDETARATSYRLDHVRQSFMLARSLLRVLLGQYLGAAPGTIQFSYGPRGKPKLVSPLIEFNLSYSNSLALFAFTIGCELGIDVEEIRPLPEMHQIAKGFFCPEEQQELMSLPTEERERAFFLCWTRKEAYIKALGHGLSVPLDSFRVTLKLDEPARLIHVAHSARSASVWTLHNLEIQSRYASALAYRAAPRAIHVYPLIQSAELL